MRFFVMLSLFLAPAALAQEDPDATIPEDGQAVVYQPVTEIEFGTVHVETGIERPGVELVRETRHKGHGSLIDIRTDFSAEIIQSVDETR